MSTTKYFLGIMVYFVLFFLGIVLFALGLNLLTKFMDGSSNLICALATSAILFLLPILYFSEKSLEYFSNWKDSKTTIEFLCDNKEIDYLEPANNHKYKIIKAHKTNNRWFVIALQTLPPETEYIRITKS